MTTISQVTRVVRQQDKIQVVRSTTDASKKQVFRSIGIQGPPGPPGDDAIPPDIVDLTLVFDNHLI